MKLLIHDLKDEEAKEIFPSVLEDIKIISDDGTIHTCIGCFGCWVKTPAACIIRDKYGDMGEYLSKCQELIIVSKCFYGGFSPFIKNVMDRSISYIHPYFIIRNGEMHHRKRYDTHFNLKVFFYGENITEDERKIAEKLIKANSINLDCVDNEIIFAQNIKEIKGEIL